MKHNNNIYTMFYIVLSNKLFCARLISVEINYYVINLIVFYKMSYVPNFKTLIKTSKKDKILALNSTLFRNILSNKPLMFSRLSSLYILTIQVPALAMPVARNQKHFKT